LAVVRFLLQAKDLPVAQANPTFVLPRLSMEQKLRILRYVDAKTTPDWIKEARRGVRGVRGRCGGPENKKVVLTKGVEYTIGCSR
jgi:hypothetical protein